MKAHHDDQQPSMKTTESSMADDRLRAIAYSVDALIPGLYVWFGTIRIRLGGRLAEENYPGTIHSPVGIALVLPD